MWDSCLENGVATLACIPIVIKNLVNALLAFSGIVAIVLIIYGGVKYIQSKGDQQAIDDARRTITYAIIGLFVIFLSFFIINIISQVTGAKQIANPSL